MKVAVLADIHGNLPALEAVLAEVDAAAPDLVVVCGDVASGPLPAESIDLLRSLPGARFVSGNADRGLVSAFDGAGNSSGPLSNEWCAAQISQDQRDFLASFVETVSVAVDALGRVLFCHGSPRSDEEMMTSETADERLGAFVAGVDADVVVCGHTHMQFDRMAGSVRVVNPGSVGMPYGEPGAYWALLGPEVEMRRTDYDRDAAAERIRQSTWPDAEEFATSNVVSVPSKEQALAFFRAHGGP